MSFVHVEPLLEGVLDVGLFGLVVAVVVHVHGLARHERLVGLVLECFVEGLDLLVLRAAVQRQDDLAGDDRLARCQCDQCEEEEGGELCGH